MLKFLLILFMPLSESKGASLNLEKLSIDTTIVGRVIEMDSIFIEENYSRTGVKYFYGIHHIKVELLDISSADRIVDTLVLGYVYNRQTEMDRYKENFGFKKGVVYLFDVHLFTPCCSDFPRIQGICIGDRNIFLPRSNSLIFQYNSILRIIFSTEFKN